MLVLAFAFFGLVLVLQQELLLVLDADAVAVDREIFGSAASAPVVVVIAKWRSAVAHSYGHASMQRKSSKRFSAVAYARELLPLQLLLRTVSMPHPQPTLALALALSFTPTSRPTALDAHISADSNPPLYLR